MAQTGSRSIAATESASDRATPLPSVGRANHVSLQGVRLLCAALAAIALLFLSEIVHYAVTTDLGVNDQIPLASAAIHPYCEERGSRYDLRCAFPPFNSVREICAIYRCTYGDSNLPSPTAQSREQDAAIMAADENASLQVELPYSHASADWRQRVIDLQSTRGTAAKHLPLTTRAETIPDAQIIVQERSLEISRDVAQKWLDEHGR